MNKIMINSNMQATIIDKKLIQDMNKKYPTDKFELIRSKSNTSKRNAYAFRPTDTKVDKEAKTKEIQKYLEDYEPEFFNELPNRISSRNPYYLRIKNNGGEILISVKTVQPRVSEGDVNSKLLQKFLGSIGLSIKSFASISEKTQDVVAGFQGQNIGFEVKGARSFTSKVTVFDRSMPPDKDPRGGPEIDKLAVILSKKMKGINSKNVKNFRTYINEIRKIDTEVGFPGQPGVKAAGGSFKIKYGKAEDRSTINEFIEVLKEHFAEGKDNYFVIVNSSSQSFVIADTGFGVPSYFKGFLNLLAGIKKGTTNPVQKLSAEMFSSVGIAQYGTISKGLRMGIYLTLSPAAINKSFKMNLDEED